MSPGLGGMIATEVKFTLYELPKRPKIQSYIGGLGGRDIKLRDFENIYLELDDIANGKKDVEICKWINLDLEAYNKFAIEV
jgi:pyruvate ferredoxin oxidoreductase alpha subunit